MRRALFAILFTLVALSPAAAADGDGPAATSPAAPAPGGTGEERSGDDPVAAPPAMPAPGRTGKERLSDKGSDEQRVDDCKVPAGRRTRERPVGCPWDVGS
jgi:hypothetical protein